MVVVIVGSVGRLMRLIACNSGHSVDKVVIVEVTTDLGRAN